MTLTECEYFIQLLIRQIEQQNQMAQLSPHANDNAVDLEFIHERARLTIEVLVENLVVPEVENKVFFEYYREPTIHNVAKLLIRAKKLYEARAEAKKILEMLTEVEAIL